MANDTDEFYMTPEEYEEAVEGVRYIERERGIKFTEDEFKRMIILLHDPALYSELEL